MLILLLDLSTCCFAGAFCLHIQSEVTTGRGSLPLKRFVQRIQGMKGEGWYPVCAHTRVRMYIKGKSSAILTSILNMEAECNCETSVTAYINQSQRPRTKSTSIYVHIILSSIYTSPEWTIALGLFHQIYQYISHSLTRATYFVNKAI